MVEGEYESLKAIHDASPTFVPRPLAWGKLSVAQPEARFLLEEFRNISEHV